MGIQNSCFTVQSKHPNRQEVPKNIIQLYIEPILKYKYKQLPEPQCRSLYGQFHYKVQPIKTRQMKVPLDSLQRTKFIWKKMEIWQYPFQKLKNLTEQKIKERTFLQKYIWFQNKLQIQKSKYGKGYNKLQVDPTNVLLSSSEGFQKIDFNLQTKIVFTDDKAAIDGGGLFRQWANMCMLEAFSQSLGMFKLCETDQTAYKIIVNKINQPIFEKYAKIIGYVIGKSMMQKIPLNCYLNRTILRLLSSQSIHLSDVYNYDIQIYNSLKSILQNPISEQDLISFTCMVKDPFTDKQKQFQLVKGGNNIYLNDDNKEQFAKKMINLYCYSSIQPIIKAIRTSLYEVIPYKYLQIFQPYQLQMLICGKQQIDVKDWKKNTQYKGYVHNDQIIQWFWQIVSGFDQTLRSNLLHFCTGSSKVPISGFKFLQCKRGKPKKFNIKKVNLNNQNPYPKGITCFNKLQLPPYQTKEQLQIKLLAICQEQIHDFGLDNVKH